MPQYLLVAEANKIQDLVFRSAYLRQVVGASGLLKRFCEEGVAALQGAMPAGRRCETVVNDGGSFSLLFDDRDEATRFRRALAQLYVEATGSTITVAQPQEMRDKDAFPQANEAARRALQQAKAAGRGPAATAQGPHVAVCSSCGVGLASKHDRLYKGDPQPAHLCASCRDKANERNSKGLDFLRGFRDAVVGVGERRFDEPGQEEEGAAAWDPRGYVAYLVADANGTGRLFGLCKTAEQLRGLSQGFTQLVTKSLAKCAEALLARAPEAHYWRIPILPLILGGDDVFALIPAPYALSVAQRFCQEYERRMKDLLAEQEIDAPQPTMSAAVVICKSKYPYRLAHARGEELLKETKRVAKVAATEGYRASAVHWEVILGNRLAGEEKDEQPFEAGMRPYWVSEASPPEGQGLPLQQVLSQRLVLKDLPRGRMAQLQALFAEPPASAAGDEVDRWAAEMRAVIQRVGRSPSLEKALDQALHALGGSQFGYWYYLTRRTASQRVPPYTQGLPDLLEGWDWAYDLGHGRDDYEPKER